MSGSRFGKDIVNKHLMDYAKDGFLRWLGVEAPAIVDVISPNIETVNIREDLLDLVVRLADDSLGHFEFQSTREPTLFRFFLYDAHLFFNLQRPIRTFVLYTAPTDQAPEVLETGVMTYRVQNVFIYQRDGKVAYQRLQNHLESGIWGLDDELDTAFLVFMRGGPGVEAVLELILQIPEATSKRHTAAMVYGLATAQMSEEQRQSMEEEFQVKSILEKWVDEAADKKFEAGRVAERVELARTLLLMGDTIDKVVKATKLSHEQVEQIRQQLH